MERDTLFLHLWRQVCQLEEARRVAWQQLTTPAAIAARQRWVRERVQAMIGPFPERCDLRARVTRTLDRPTYTVEAVIFESRPRFPVTASLYLPKERPGLLPAVVSPCGHSANGRLYENYQRMHLALVQQGFAVLSYDPISQGERLQYLDAAGKSTLAGCCHEHCMAGNQINLTGAGFANVRIWDGIRALDYLLSRPEIDPQRVGVAGNSGGGTLSAYLLCVDDRYAAGAPACYITTLVHRIATRMAADAEQQFVPMLQEGLDHADLLLPAAPKPVLIGAAVQDFFPIAGARQTAADLASIYEVLGRREQTAIATADAPHGWSQPLREATVRWFNRWLRDRDTAYQEPAITTEADATLYATASGQVLTSEPQAATIHEIVQRDFAVSPSCRTAADPAAALRAGLPALLGIDPAAATRPWPRPWWPVPPVALPPAPAGLRLEAVQLLSDYDVELRGVLLTPARRTGQAVLLACDEAGLAPLLTRAGRAVELAAAGAVVLVIEPRGVGSDVGPVPQQQTAGRYYGFYGVEVDLTYTSWMIGRPLVGQRTFDLLCAAHWLRQKGLPVALYGVGEGGLLALLAAALDPQVTSVTAEGMLVSWQNLFDTPVYDYLPGILPPGILRLGDLPDVAAAVAPRPVSLRGLVDARRQPLAADAVRSAYAPAVAAFERCGAPERLEIE
ncbi:MAG: acetylxylan esterase [Fimbriimonadaceae bacterium]|nr:acetylxylan esterase [Fimbriimonadaceae bacterium]